jgi:hypothetical protein
MKISIYRVEIGMSFMGRDAGWENLPNLAGWIDDGKILD